MKAIILRIRQTSVIPTPAVEESSQYRSLVYRATEVIAFVFFVVHCFSLMLCYLHLIIRMDTNSKYGFHHWIPELELGYKLLYMPDTNRCFKIVILILAI